MQLPEHYSNARSPLDILPVEQIHSDSSIPVILGPNSLVEGR